MFRRSNRNTNPIRQRLRLEYLENREVPTTLVGLTTSETLVTFDSSVPGTIGGSPVSITGLQGSETLIGIAYRPATDGLYGVGSLGTLYVINPTSGTATRVGTGFGVALSGSQFGVSFDPISDKLQVISNTGQNLTVSPTTGMATTQTALTYDSSNANNQGYFSGTYPSPNIVAIANTTDTDATTNSTVTTLYGIDASLNVVDMIGGPESSPSPTAGAVAYQGDLGLTTAAPTGFAIEPVTDAAYLVNGGTSGSTLYSINLALGTGTSIGNIGSGLTLDSLAVAPPAAGAGAISLASSTLSFTVDRTPLAVTVTRTGGATGAVTVDYSATSGSAVSGTDFVPASGTISFANGQITQTIVLQLPVGSPTAAAPAKTFTLTLNNATGGATLGATTWATITIPAVSSTPTSGQTPTAAPTKLFAVASSDDTGLVYVYDAATNNLVFSFAPFGTGFSGGISVATGDVAGLGYDDVIVGAGSGGGPRVEVIDGQSQGVLADFYAFDSGQRGGVNVAAGDANGDGFADVIVGAGNGGGPRVEVFNGASLIVGTQTPLANFFAFASNFRGGVNVASAVFGGNAYSDVVVGAGNGGGPQVEVYDGKSFAIEASYFAYDSSVRGGVFVAAGNLTTGGDTDVITGTGLGGGPNVRVFDGLTTNQLSSFFAYSSSLGGGVRVGTVSDSSTSGTTSILTGSGPGGPSTVGFFDEFGNSTGTLQPSFASGYTGGVYVG